MLYIKDRSTNEETLRKYIQKRRENEKLNDIGARGKDHSLKTISKEDIEKPENLSGRKII